MRIRSLTIVAAVLASAAVAYAADAPLTDTRLTVHTLVREDIFAGFDGDMERLARGEKNLQQLLAQRPNDRPMIVTWQAAALAYRAALAREAGRNDEYQRLYKQAVTLFDEAKAGPGGIAGIAPLYAPSTLLFADRFAPEDRPAAYARAYEGYQAVWAQQGTVVDQLPLHMKGELLSGLAQVAQRTGRTEEMNKHLDKMLVSLAGTPYEATARRWKDDPKAASGTMVICKNCHDSGRLAPTLARLDAAAARPAAPSGSQ
jgi:hypothetical protein